MAPVCQLMARRPAPDPLDEMISSELICHSTSWHTFLPLRRSPLPFPRQSAIAPSGTQKHSRGTGLLCDVGQVCLQ